MKILISATIFLFTFVVLSGLLSVATSQQPRPSLVNERIHVSSILGNGHTTSFDGRIVIKKNSVTTWRAQVLRPEKILYDDEGKPSFQNLFSQGVDGYVSSGENALAMCLPDSQQVYHIDNNGTAVYDSFIFDSRMFPDTDALFRHFRRRRITVHVQDPFTEEADVSYFDTADGQLEYLTTVDGSPILGIEPSITRDGKLMIFNGTPSGNKFRVDYLMYTYNSNPCAANNWSVPLPLHRMKSDPKLERYPIAWKKLKAATGEEYTDGAPLRGAYPWIDREGRDVLYIAVNFISAGARRDVVSFIGADTKWMAYNIDGGTNFMRQGFPKLFYSSPMWNLERERHSSQNSPSTTNEKHYLPVTKSHDVLPLFGSNTGDYTEVDFGEITDPFHILYLPMNELVTRHGEYDFERTPDLSGYFSTGELIGDAYTTWNITLTSSSTGSLHEVHANDEPIDDPCAIWNATLDPYFSWNTTLDPYFPWNTTSSSFSTGSLQEAHSKGRALVLNMRGGHDGGLRSILDPGAPGVSSSLAGFTVQLNIRPDDSIGEECGHDTRRHLLHIPDAMTLFYHRNHTLQLKMKIDDQWISLGRSESIPRSRWSHIAYSWDGVSGSFAEYVDGISSGRQLPTKQGLFNLGASREVLVGTLSYHNPANCSNFVGAIDEVRLFSHARSGRSICLTTYGTNCIKSAIQDIPSTGQNVLSHQQPECNGRQSISSMACQSALHRVCAQKGASRALSTTRNIVGTVKQLISNRPPISLGGVFMREADGIATVACAPLSQESVAVTFEELSKMHHGCIHDQLSDSMRCASATKRFCQSIGWDTGLIFEVTSRAWIVCFNAHLIEYVEESELNGNCREQSWTGVECRLKTSEWCQKSGYNAGIIQEIINGTVAQVHCFYGYLVDEFDFTRSDESLAGRT